MQPRGRVGALCRRKSAPQGPNRSTKKKKTMALLVLAAFAPELEGLPAQVARDVVGIGLVEASSGAERVLAKWGPGAVVLVGTCGIYPGHAEPPFVVARRVMVADAAVAHGQAEFVPARPEAIECDAGLREILVSIASD